ncbi:uncharacterized protein LOC143793286 isoform X2 [Ranitomeya variabilis]|uniref:uncharacterized protein LOC143793286 isoform X2 n=1 Tax=Ranitomeya variabilis TaxID=490064 RepID=UPI004055E090
MSLVLVLSVLGVLTITGFVETITISTAQPEVTGYENVSNVLAVSYQTSKSTDWLQIRWNIIHPKPLHLILCTIRLENISSSKMFPENGYESRMTIDPASGSLIIKHLKMEDSGIYKVSVLDNEHENWILINVTVLPAQTEGPAPTAVQEGQCICSSNSSSASVPMSAWILLSSRVSSILLALLVLFGIHFKNRNQSQRRTLRTLPTNRHRW